MDSIPLDLLDGIGLAGFLALLIISLIRGWIVVGPVYKAQVAETGYWRDAAATKDETILELSKQNGELIRTSAALESKLTTAALNAASGGGQT